MSTLWTPEGERPIRRDPAASQEASPPGPAGGPGDAAAPETEPTPEQMQAEMDRLRDQLARTPAEVVVANHAFGLFELAALHLSLQPPQLDQARLAIDALAALVDGIGSRLGDAAPQLTEGLSQLRLAFVKIHGVAQSRPAADAGEGPAGSNSA